MNIRNKSRKEWPLENISRFARSELILRGKSIRRWATERGYSIPTVTLALRGHSGSDLSKRIRDDISKELGL